MQKSLTILDREKSLVELDKAIAAYESAAPQRDTETLVTLRLTRDKLVKSTFEKLSPWDEVLLARHQDRPYSLDYIALLFEDYTELHGDRISADDQAIIGGLARFGTTPVMLIAQQKGRDLKERDRRNFGYARPAGYRKAMRLMALAAKIGLPVITFVDTPGADSNVVSEEQNISDVIARCLMEMSALRAPIISIIIGEGGSGGAISLAVADKVLMLEHAIYSVIAPEGCAAILETFGRDPSRRAEAAAALRLTARGAKGYGLVDDVLPEPDGPAHRNLEGTAESIRTALNRELRGLLEIPIDELVESRYQKFRSMGVYGVMETAVVEPISETQDCNEATEIASSIHN